MDVHRGCEPTWHLHHRAREFWRIICSKVFTDKETSLAHNFGELTELQSPWLSFLQWLIDGFLIFNIQKPLHHLVRKPKWRNPSDLLLQIWSPSTLFICYSRKGGLDSWKCRSFCHVVIRSDQPAWVRHRQGKQAHVGLTENSKGGFFRRKSKLTDSPGTPDAETDPAKWIQNPFHPNHRSRNPGPSY